MPGATGVVQEAANKAVLQAFAEMHLPDTLHGEFTGDSKLFQWSCGSQGLLLYAALISVYIVLGVLYESLAHPITIISTLPSAGLGALLALQVTGMEITLIALIGIVLLIGIVKKNGIMLVDFALYAERHRDLGAEDAIFEACIERFRPILMTTIAGGLIVSQVMTLYTTPAIYIYLDKLHHLLRRLRWPGRRASTAPAPAE